MTDAPENKPRWCRDDVPVLTALALALGADQDEAYDVAACLISRHRPTYNVGITEQVEAAITALRRHD